MTPIIFHLDMNSFFATVAQQENPEYRGKPLGVCEHLGGIIIAASVQAKKWGIKTGTPVWEAKKIYPKIILTHTLPSRYRFYIKKVIEVVSDYTGEVEQASIDELYANMTKACNVRKVTSSKFQVESGDQMVDPFAEAIDIAKEIKTRIKKEVGDYLTCSIGIAENKLLAKIGSDLQKPDGLVVVTSDKLQVTSQSNGSSLILCKDDLYYRLKLTDIPGIARRTEKNLNKLGIKTLLDLKNFPKEILFRKFGINGYHLYKMGQLEGSWKPEVVEDTKIKSIGHMYTLPKEYREEKFFAPVLYKLCEMVGRRLRKKDLAGNIVHFFVRASESYESFGQSRKLGFYLYDGREIFEQCMSIFESLNVKVGDFRMIGVTVAGLKEYQNQLSLFGDSERARTVTTALDKINVKYGDFTVCRVPVLAAKNVFHDSVGFGRIKEK